MRPLGKPSGQRRTSGANGLDAIIRSGRSPERWSLGFHSRVTFARHGARDWASNASRSRKARTKERAKEDES
jgi:hypothetical protein